MTTDGPSGSPEPDQPRPAAIDPGADYPDPRDDARRQDDEAVGAEQSAALTDSGDDPHRRVDDLIAQIQEQRRGAEFARLPDPPIQFDVYRRPSRPGGPDQGDIILVASGELQLRVPPDGQPGGPPGPGREHEAASAGEQPPSPSQQAAIALDNLGYRTSPLHDSPRGRLPLLTYVHPDRDVEQLVQDRDQVRAETGAEVDLNYVVTAGHLVKADDWPRSTAAHRCYSPEWIRSHPVRRSVTVAVIDTGINHLSRTDGWLTGVPQNNANVDPLDVLPADGVLDLSAGHGTFVAGVVEQVAPLCDIRVYRAVDTDGLGRIDDVGNAIVQAAADGADIINLSLGTMTVDDLPPLALTIALDIVRDEHPDVLVVASAGNMGLDTPMFPAAMKDVIGVGALAADLTPAPWSSHGFWVNCSAIGVGVISTFVPGTEPPHTEDGNTVTEEFGPDAWAIWSGTSFSAPQIAGGVAQLCQLSGVSPAIALGRLLAGKPTRPGYGFVVPILPGT